MSILGTYNTIIWPKMPKNCKNFHATVPKFTFLVLKINVLIILGHAILCPFSAHARTCNSLTCNMLTKL